MQFNSDAQLIKVLCHQLPRILGVNLRRLKNSYRSAAAAAAAGGPSCCRRWRWRRRPGCPCCCRRCGGRGCRAHQGCRCEQGRWEAGRRSKVAAKWQHALHASRSRLLGSQQRCKLLLLHEWGGAKPCSQQGLRGMQQRQRVRRQRRSLRPACNARQLVQLLLRQLWWRGHAQLLCHPQGLQQLAQIRLPHHLVLLAARQQPPHTFEPEQHGLQQRGVEKLRKRDAQALCM